MPSMKIATFASMRAWMALTKPVSPAVRAAIERVASPAATDPDHLTR